MKATEHKDYNFYENLHKEQGEMINPTEGFSGHITLLAFKSTISLYLQSLAKIKVINNIHWENIDVSYAKAVLNTSHISSKKEALMKAEKDVRDREELLFPRLLKQPNPYYILLCPIYYFTTIFDEKTSGYKKDFGVTDLALEACERFYKYEINN